VKERLVESLVKLQMDLWLLVGAVHHRYIYLEGSKCFVVHKAGDLSLEYCRLECQ
jgi:hypothetical protein